MTADRIHSAPASRSVVRRLRFSAMVILALSTCAGAFAQSTSRTLVAVLAHGDDEVGVAPVLARYAREGVDVHVILATDGSQGGANTSVPTGPELAGVRAQEARCAAEALGIHPPVLLDFPDGKLGDYISDRSLIYRLTERIAEELHALAPDAVITFGPEGGTGHPDHRLVGSIVAQLLRAEAPGVPQRLFYMGIPAGGFRAINPQRGEPPLLIPQPRYLSVRVPVTETDLEAARRAMECHETQFTAEIVERVFPAMTQAWNGNVPLAPAFLTETEGTDIFE